MGGGGEWGVGSYVGGIETGGAVRAAPAIGSNTRREGVKIPATHMRVVPEPAVERPTIAEEEACGIGRERCHRNERLAMRRRRRCAV